MRNSLQARRTALRKYKLWLQCERKALSLSLTILLTLFSYSSSSAAQKSEMTDSGLPWSGSSSVRVSELDGQAMLTVNGTPFFVNGAGMSYRNEAGIHSLANAGGNAFRTWDTAAIDVQLDAASKHGLMVLVGLELGTQLQGFDYSDNDAVAEQAQRLLATVQRYKDHPALLGWILGNEPNLMVNDLGEVVPADTSVYAAIGDLAQSINAADPDHPTTVTFAFTATLAEDIRNASSAAPALDFISLQAYGALPAISRLMSDPQLRLPFMITEYGPLGHWEMPATQWGREIEEPSGHKAEGMIARMQNSIINDPTGRLLGSFAFLWGQKQERTPTWYGLFLQTGERTASVDELTRVWTGSWPENRAPSAWAITLAGETATQSVMVKPGEHVSASAQITDPENDTLRLRWELREEVDERSHGGHFERTPQEVSIADLSTSRKDEQYQASFTAPSIDGEYRLFVYAFDDSDGAATANIPFKVRK